MSDLTRRRFLHTFAAAGIATSGMGVAQAQSSGSSAPELAPPPTGTLPFLHGVASGDPLSDTVILWTRVTPGAEALPGSGLGPDVRLTWEVATDVSFSTHAASGQATATAASDHTVHVDPWGLNPDTVYFFRFTVAEGDHAGAVSPVGRTRTAPSLSASPEALNFAVASCANWEAGFFSAYSDIAARGSSGDLDVVVFVGDYIYEYGVGEYSGNGPVREVEPRHEIVSLADYRTRYGQYRTDQDLQAAHAALPWVVVWDDHETANNSWREGAENHTPGAEGDWITRRNAAMQAYFEWLPIRATSPSKGGHLYRSLQFGDLVDLTMMDLRTYRDQDASFNPVTFNDPSRTTLGSEQFEWLSSRLSTSTARWKVLGNSVMFSPMNLITLRQDSRTSSVADFLGEHRVSGIGLNGDQWDGYAAERSRLLDILAESDSPTLFLTGDIHTEWAHSVMAHGREVGCELVCASVSAPNIDEILGLPPENAVSHLAEDYLRMANPHLKHVDLDQHGYGIVRITRKQATMQFLRLPDVTVQGAALSVAHEMTWKVGEGFVTGVVPTSSQRSSAGSSDVLSSSSS